MIRYRGGYLGPLSTSAAITFARSLAPKATPAMEQTDFAPHPPIAELEAGGHSPAPAE